jgi:pyruvate/2-oxoglutarate dehydrogenase complex dihydrolipoamide acyltransferase (E2) component
MAIELKVPEVGESITEVMIGVWKKMLVIQFLRMNLS